MTNPTCIFRKGKVLAPDNHAIVAEFYDKKDAIKKRRK
jgi:hypothetical protein